MKINVGGQKGIKKFNRTASDDWTIVDVREGADVHINLLESDLPFDDNSVDAIYTSHTLEHIFPDRLPAIMNEFFRVLKEGHKIRVVVPDLDIAIKAYYNNDRKFLKNLNNPRRMSHLPGISLCYLSSWFFTYRLREDGSRGLEGGHVMSFNFDVMDHYLLDAGFCKIDKMKYNKCSKIFKGCDFERYKKCSLYVEAVKIP
jgi:predicted SAM-dependent methyltransferase